MEALSLSQGIRFSSLSTSRNYKLREVSHSTNQLSFIKDFTHALILRPDDTNRRLNYPWKNNGKSKSGEGEISQSSDDAKSAKQKEIIALFRHIQASISKGNPISTPVKKRTVSNSSRDDYKPSTESVLEILRQSRKQEKGGPSWEKEGAKKEKLQKEEIEQVYQQVKEFKIHRPPSNFVKKSPVPSFSILREKMVELSNTTEIGSKRIEEMKVSELKEVAKSRGVKGYSKLKKNELIELLRSSYM